ncbi:MAG: hypothetical protein QG608_89 [Actinomycetota bacterium]|nr:hypothetical protein [Actinomycetota bacterium]
MATHPAELAGSWTIDQAHSTLGFVAKHAMISKTRGEFSAFTGGAVIDVENPERSSGWVDIDVASVTTRNEQRDEHLRGADFFDVASHPTITFRSTSARPDGEAVVLVGDLTVRGATRPVEVRWEFGGMAKDPFGNTRAGFEGSSALSRKDFGLTWNAVLETGGVLVSDKIDLNLEISALKGDQQ